MATVKISKLPVYVGLQIKSTDLIPVACLQLDGESYVTQRATAVQISSYVINTIATTTERPFSSTDIVFNTINVISSLSANSVSAYDISGVYLYGDGSHLTGITLSNQALNTTSTVMFSSLTATSISAAQISADYFYGDGSHLTGITLSNQALSTTSSVMFSSVSANTISASYISAGYLYGDGSHLTNIYNQTLNTTNSVTFNAITANNTYIATISSTNVITNSLTALSAQFTSLSANQISATKIYLGASTALGKYVEYIDHVGSTDSVFYSIYHPLDTVALMVQVYEVELDGDLALATRVLVGVTHHVEDVANLINVEILALTNAKYMVIIAG